MGDQAYPKSLTSWAGVVSARKSPAQMANQMATQWRREWRRDTELRAQTAKHMATQWHLIWRRNTQSPSSGGVGSSPCVSFFPFRWHPMRSPCVDSFFAYSSSFSFFVFFLKGVRVVPVRPQDGGLNARARGHVGPK